MKLVIDAVGNKNGGGATVLMELLRACTRVERIKQVTILASPQALREFEIPVWAGFRIVDVAAAESATGRFLWAARGLDRHLTTIEYDALLGLNGFGSVTGARASVVFIQQPMPYSRETLRRCSWEMRFRMALIRRMTRRSARAADHVLVQSETMKEAICRAFDISAAKISAFMPGAPVLPQPVTDSPKLRDLRAGSRTGALLYVGSGSPHKNLDVVGDGLLLLPEAERPKWYVTLPADWKFCRAGVAISLGTLNGAELYEAYCNVTAVVISSLTETVGLPMLEAMRLGIPVLAADRPYAHEVCEDAAAFFDPLSPKEFASQARRLMVDHPRRSQLSARGVALIKRRDGEDSYRAMLERVVEVSEAAADRNGEKYRGEGRRKAAL